MLTSTKKNNLGLGLLIASDVTAKRFQTCRSKCSIFPMFSHFMIKAYVSSVKLV